MGSASFSERRFSMLARISISPPHSDVLPPCTLGVIAGRAQHPKMLVERWCDRVTGSARLGCSSAQHHCNSRVGAARVAYSVLSTSTKCE